MKKLFLLAFIATYLFSACSSDDSIHITENNFSKKWYRLNYQVNDITQYYEHKSCKKDFIEFLPDGSYIEEHVQNCTPLTVETYDGEWFLDGNTLHVYTYIFGIPYTGKITSLSDTKLQITIIGDFDGDGDDEPQKINFTSN